MKANDVKPELDLDLQTLLDKRVPSNSMVITVMLMQVIRLLRDIKAKR